MASASLARASLIMITPIVVFKTHILHCIECTDALHAEQGSAAAHCAVAQLPACHDAALQHRMLMLSYRVASSVRRCRCPANARGADAQH
jgi:hypothetical protein